MIMNILNSDWTLVPTPGSLHHLYTPPPPPPPSPPPPLPTRVFHLPCTPITTVLCLTCTPCLQHQHPQVPRTVTATRWCCRTAWWCECCPLPLVAPALPAKLRRSWSVDKHHCSHPRTGRAKAQWTHAQNNLWCKLTKTHPQRPHRLCGSDRSAGLRALTILLLLLNTVQFQHYEDSGTFSFSAGWVILVFP